MEIAVEFFVEGDGGAVTATVANSERLQLQLLGGVGISRAGVALPLPPSRKVRALLAFLAVTPGTTRTRLCELLWDVPNDPRGELRWHLSKLRGLLDDDECVRVDARGDHVRLDLSGCDADVVRIANAGKPEDLDLDQLRELCGLFKGEFADGLTLDRNPQFSSWLGAQRRRFQAVHVALLEQLYRRLDPDSEEAFACLEKWVQLAPFDVRGHELLLAALVNAGKVPQAEEHLAATIRMFEAEGLEWLSLRERWRALRSTPSPKVHAPVVESQPAPVSATPRPRASVCIMPFVDRTGSAVRGGWADGLTEDVITRLAKLRVLFVIARGSAFALRERNISPDEAGRLLNVDYVVSGSLRSHGDRIGISIELSETRTARIVWADELTHKRDDALLLPDEISNRIVAAIAEEVESAERARAIVTPVGSLDAWSAYHRGLWHMYRFSRDDNAQAAHFFEESIRQDPGFARAHAGLSFTHFQNAFLGHTNERQRAIDSAFEAAGRSLVADDRDPAAHWAMGRALWLRGKIDDARLELEQSVSLSPNFALGHYTLGFVNAQSGDMRVAIESADHSRQLSPFDPLQFAMLATRGLAHFRLAQYDEAAAWATKAAARPNAHVHILAIAAHCLGATGRLDEADGYVRAIRKTSGTYGIDDFLGAFRFAPDTVSEFRKIAARIGL